MKVTETQELFFMKRRDSLHVRMQGIPSVSVPGMGDNLVVKVHYALGSRKR